MDIQTLPHKITKINRLIPVNERTLIVHGEGIDENEQEVAFHAVVKQADEANLQKLLDFIVPTTETPDAATDTPIIPF